MAWMIVRFNDVRKVVNDPSLKTFPGLPVSKSLGHHPIFRSKGVRVSYETAKVAEDALRSLEEKNRYLRYMVCPVIRSPNHVL